MNAFVNAIGTPNKTVTTNGMVAFDKTGSKLVDMFFNIGAARNNPNIVPQFMQAFAEDKLLATKMLFWARDVRGGAGERKVFRDILSKLAVTNPDLVKKNLPLVAKYGRWDDLLILKGDVLQSAYRLIGTAIKSGNGLCGKWMPRKGPEAAALRSALGMSPKQYRKTLVGLTSVVETQMCAKTWDNIEFGHVPSIAAARYQKAFAKNAEVKYKEYRDALVTGEAKINASSIFPHDVIKSLQSGLVDVATAQWNALPNYLGDQKVLALVDVSGSMSCPAGKNSNTTCLDVSLSLGLYVSDKLTGAFKDTFLTFSASPQLLTLKGSIAEKLGQLESSDDWEMNTNIELAFDAILKTAVKANAPQEDMPDVLLIMSDMQFDQCADWGDTMQTMMQRKYENAGYKVPTIVFWNLNGSHGNVPGTSVDKGVMMVSGFSPAILKAVLACDLTNVTPYSMMLEVLNGDRYANVTV
jgi:hypothetical protein